MELLKIIGLMFAENRCAVCFCLMLVSSFASFASGFPTFEEKMVQTVSKSWIPPSNLRYYNQENPVEFVVKYYFVLSFMQLLL